MTSMKICLLRRPNGEEKSDVTLLWWQNFWITTIESLSNDYGDSKDNWKSNRFISAKQQLWTCIRLFYTFLSHRCTTATWNVLISRTRFTKKASTTQKKNIFPFLDLDTVLLHLTPDVFAIIRQIKWNWIRSSKFETVQILFLSDVFGLLSTRNFAAMATSPLY